MSIAEMIGQSGILTLLGMGVVFSFLIILILFMYLLHAILHALNLDKDSEKKVESVAASSAAPEIDNGAVVAAIAAAVREKELR